MRDPNIIIKFNKQKGDLYEKKQNLWYKKDLLMSKIKFRKNKGGGFIITEENLCYEKDL